MLRLALVALLATSACRTSLEDEPDAGAGRACTVVTMNAACVAAEGMPSVTLTWIEQNVFTPNCGGPSCHGTTTGGGPPVGRLTLTADSHPKLVNADASFATGRKLVVPGSVPQSYLMVIMRGITLAEAEPSPAPAPSGDRYMPLGSPPICCQKLDAIARWITAGALDN